MSNEVPKVEVIASPEFKRRLKALAKRYRKVYSDLQPVFESLEFGVFLGEQIPGTNYTVLKLRIRNSDAQSGKSGGYRLIYQIIEPQLIRLVLIYSKSEQEKVAAKTIKEIIESCSDE
ncbi:MAG: type II toxin-antitoxin system RelE/ParE family toxin [Cyanobacteria bacterium CRU_2_1]|nr:type II toxin-antitoxin system RelE/ParE family toxin [Cyanobacteria bacterium CRU_2_1]